MSMDNEYPGAVCNLDASVLQDVAEVGVDWVNDDDKLITQSSLTAKYGEAISTSSDDDLWMTVEGSGSTTVGNCHNTEWSMVDGELHLDQMMDLSWMQAILMMEEEDIPEIEFPSIDMDACGNFQFPEILDFMAWDMPCEDETVCECSEDEPDCAVTATLALTGITIDAFEDIQDDFLAATEAALGLSPGSVIIVDMYYAKRSDDAGNLIVVLEFVPAEDGDDLMVVLTDPAFIEELDTALEIFGITAEVEDIVAPPSWPEECQVDNCVSCDLDVSACSVCSPGYELQDAGCDQTDPETDLETDLETDSETNPLDTTDINPASSTAPYLTLQLAFCALLALLW